MAVTKGNSDSPGVRGAAIQQAGEQGLLFGNDVAAPIFRAVAEAILNGE